MLDIPDAIVIPPTAPRTVREPAPPGRELAAATGKRTVLVCPDSFKGTLTAREAAEAIARGVHAAWPEAETILRPLADGGEGTLEALLSAGGERHATLVDGPMGDPVVAAWGTLPDGTAVVEMAQASGLTLVPEEDRDPCVASTYGTGQLIREALESGAARLLVGIGGSATNDGGAGAMQALGARFLDEEERELPHGCPALARLACLDLSGMPGRAGVAVTVACDVDNPLTGDEGATYVFGPQKGARPHHLGAMEEAMRRYARVLEETFGWEVGDAPGAGAAGGLGAALMGFLGAIFRPGIDVVMDAVGFDEAVNRADLILTGEGCLDDQSLHGKTIAGVLRRAAGKPVVALCGQERLSEQGIIDLFRAGLSRFYTADLFRDTDDPALRLELLTRMVLLT